ncbi:MAG: hypothetical protein DWI07_00485 [Planctomycetota bacterium]|nr:MAG: hypothetical protein DWI07_00485 [Planctomycetota bacterium]
MAFNQASRSFGWQYSRSGNGASRHYFPGFQTLLLCNQIHGSKKAAPGAMAQNFTFNYLPKRTCLQSIQNPGIENMRLHS